MFGLYTLRGTERESGSVLRFRSVLASIALAGIGLSILGMMVLAASMGGVSVDQVDRATINMVISGTSIGTIWQVRVAALLLVLSFSIVGCVAPLLLSVHFRSRQRSLFPHWPGPVTGLPLKA